MATLRATFPKSLRVHSAQEIDTLFHKGRRRSNHPLSAHGIRREDNGPARIAISIGRACGNAVQRNEIKRKIREAFRLMQHDVPPGSDYLLVIRPHKPLEMLQYQDRLRQLLRGDTIPIADAKALPEKPRPPKRGKGKGREKKK